MNRQKNNSMDRRKIIGHNTQSSTETIPIELIVEILSRLPAKSVAICRCVSKLWRSLLRPRLSLTFEFGGKWHFFSSPQPHQDLTVVSADYHMGLSGNWYKEFCLSVNGLICLNEKQFLNGKIERVPVICNPSTGQRLTLPKVRAKNKDLKSFFGYDPIDKKIKVLCMTVTKYRKHTTSKEHQVLTLGTGKLSWRKIECGFPHYTRKDNNEICINGVLYYIAQDCMSPLIACFDVRSEKFSLVERNPGSSGRKLTLINYKGKLGVLMYVYDSLDELWVLDDTKEVKWSKHIFVMPNVAFQERKSIWATDTGEIAWAPSRWTHPFYVFYYNLERKSVRRVEIKGIEEKLSMGQDRPDAIFTFANNVENAMLL